MVARARAELLTRVAGHDLLVMHDTTSLCDDGNNHGLYLHVAIAVDAHDGALLGLLDATLFRRDETPKQHCNQRSLAQKESRRWVEATELADELRAAGARSVRMIADREADLYETFGLRPDGIEVLVRAHHNRVLVDASRLHEACTDQPELGRIPVALPANPGRKARTATIALRACAANIPCPHRSRRQRQQETLPDHVPLTLIEAREVDAAPGQEPLHWRLLSSQPVTTLAEAAQMVGLYRRRWDIEQVFRVMKTQGFDIEAVPILEEMPRKNLACATLIAAIQTQQMLHDRDGQAGRPMSDVIAPADQPMVEAIGRTLEGRTLRQKNPHACGSLAHLTWICARLAGWTYYGKPGPIVLVRGMVRLMTMLEGIKRSGLVRIA